MIVTLVTAVTVRCQTPYLRWYIRPESRIQTRLCHHTSCHKLLTSWIAGSKLCASKKVLRVSFDKLLNDDAWYGCHRACCVKRHTRVDILGQNRMQTRPVMPPHVMSQAVDELNRSKFCEKKCCESESTSCWMIMRSGTAVTVLCQAPCSPWYTKPGIQTWSCQHTSCHKLDDLNRSKVCAPEKVLRVRASTSWVNNDAWYGCYRVVPNAIPALIYWGHNNTNKDIPPHVMSQAWRIESIKLFVPRKIY